MARSEHRCDRCGDKHTVRNLSRVHIQMIRFPFSLDANRAKHGTAKGCTVAFAVLCERCEVEVWTLQWRALEPVRGSTPAEVITGE